MEQDMGDFEGLRDRVEHIHTEAKQFRSETSQTMHAIERRVDRLEYEDERIGERMDARDKLFSEVEEQVKDVSAKINMPWYKMVALIAPTVVAIIAAAYSVIWTLAHVPSGEKFEQLQQQVWELGAQQRTLDGKLDIILGKMPKTP